MRSLVLALTLLVVALAAIVPAEASARRSSGCSVTVSPTTGVRVHDRLRIAIRVSPATRRPVLVQSRSGRRWSTLVTRTTSRTGRVTSNYRLFKAGTLRLRVKVPRTRRFAGVLCAGPTLSVAQAVTVPAAPRPEVVAPAPPAPEIQPAFRVVYALASDQAEAAPKHDAIRNTVEQVAGWFGTQTTGNVQPRFVRGDDKAVAIRVVKLPRSAAEYAAPAEGTSFDAVAKDLAALGLPATGGKEKLAVFLDVKASTGECGRSDSSLSVLWESSCNIHPSPDLVFPYGASYLLAHEMTHAFGAVAVCAPHQGNGSHITDDPRDLLYAGPEKRDWQNLMLDPGHDDYYATGRADCPGIDGSPFWTKTSDPLS